MKGVNTPFKNFLGPPFPQSSTSLTEPKENKAPAYNFLGPKSRLTRI